MENFKDNSINPKAIVGGGNRSVYNVNVVSNYLQVYNSNPIQANYDLYLAAFRRAYC